VRRLQFSVIVALLLVALVWCLYEIRTQARRSSVWIEVYARPVTICYSGPALRELVNVQLWPGGPVVMVKQVQEFKLPRRTSVHRDLEALPEEQKGDDDFAGEPKIGDLLP
jgi:hypothetical protein